MKLREPNIHIQATLKSTADEPVSRKNLVLQYFNMHTNSWHTFTEELDAIRGKLDQTIAISRVKKLFPGDYRLILNALTKGILPTIRLIDNASAKEEWTTVYGIIPVIHISEESVISLNFGDLWVIEPYEINRHIKGSFPENEFALIALPRPNGNHALHKPLSAALSNAEIFSDFELETHDIELRLKTDKTDPVTNREEIENLKKHLAEKEKETMHYEQDISAHKKEIDHLYHQIEELKQALQDKGTPDDDLELGEDGIIKEPPVPEARPARDVYTTIVEEVKTASEKLEESPYKLTNISLNLKTHVITDGDDFKLQLIDAETAKKSNEGTVSEVKIDIETEGPTKKPSNKLITPNIIGLTETAARNRLKSFGLGIKVIYQVSKTKTIGQAFKQSPAPGNDVTKGDTIVAIFAKKTENYN